MAAFSGDGLSDEVYCIINSGDSIDELADEINIRVSAATRFLLDSKPFSKINKSFNRLYSIDDLI